MANTEDFGRQLQQRMGQLACRFNAALDSFGGLVRHGPYANHSTIVGGSSASRRSRRQRSGTVCAPGTYRGQSTIVAGECLHHGSRKGTSATASIMAGSSCSNVDHMDEGLDLHAPETCFTAEGRSSGSASTSGRHNTVVSEGTSGKRASGRRKRAAMDRAVKHPEVLAGQRMETEQGRMQTSADVGSSLYDQNGTSVQLLADSGRSNPQNRQKRFRVRSEPSTYTVSHPADSEEIVHSSEGSASSSSDMTPQHDANSEQEPLNWKIRWRGRQPKPWLVSCSSTEEELGGLSLEGAAVESRYGEDDLDGGPCSLAYPRLQSARNSRKHGQDVLGESHQTVNESSSDRTDARGGIVADKVTCQDGGGSSNDNKQIPKWVQPLLVVRSTLDNFQKDFSHHLELVAGDLMRQLPGNKPVCAPSLQSSGTDAQNQTQVQAGARQATRRGAVLREFVLRNAQQRGFMEASESMNTGTSGRAWPRVQDSVLESGRSSWQSERGPISIHGSGSEQSNRGHDVQVETENGGGDSARWEESGRIPNSDRRSPSRGLPGWRTALTRRQAPQPWLRPRSSVVLSMLYNSRTNEVDASMSSQGTPWRVEASLGDLLGRMWRGRSRRGPPAWEAQVAGVLLQPDTALVPLHASTRHALWYGYNHKRDVHLARALVSPWAKDWQLESIVTLKPLSCLYWSMHFPNGHVLWSAATGASSSIFRTALGGLLQASGWCSREAAVSYERRVRQSGTTIRPKLSMPGGVVSVEVEQELASVQRGLMKKALCDARFLHTVNGRDKGHLVEVGFQPEDWLRLSSGVKSGRQNVAFGSASIGRSKRTPDSRGRSLTGPAVKLQVEAPPENLKRAVFTIELNKAWEF